ncbi:MAG: NAD-dependent epimerase/dehydratase family protein [Ruminiclostridium sp.]
MKRVGVLGGTGEIGKRIVNILKSEYSLITSYYTRYQESEENCVFTKIDISDTEEIKHFCEQCDIVVNCAGASYLNGEKVARIATELHIPYIDPSGEAFLEKKISDIKDDNIFVLSSGYFPGMSGLLMCYICESFDIAEKVFGLSISEETPSQSAIEDFILTNLSGFGVALSHYDNGEIKKDESEIVEIIRNKGYRFQNYLTVETERIARKYSLQKANWYNSSFGDEIIRKLQEAVIKLKLGGDEYKETVKEVIEIFRRNIKSNEQFTYIKIEGQGILDNKRICKRAEITSDCSSEISAIIAAHAVKAVLDSDLNHGIYYAMDIINSETLFENLSGLNAKLTICDVEERSIQDEYEEGAI